MTDTYAIVGKLKLQSIPDSRTLQMGWFGGLPYAVSKDFTEDELVLIFLPDGQISEEFANEHDLISRHDPETGKKINNGYLGKNRKVRSIKLMGGKIRSVGVVMKLDSLAFTGYNTHELKEGDSFNELNGVPICKKFVNPNTRRNQNKGKSVNHKREECGLKMFNKINQFYRFGNTFQKGDLITITLKLDGTSVRVGNTYHPYEPNWFERLMSKFGLKLPEFEPKELTATRRVIIERTGGDGYYGDHDLYLEVGKKLEGMLSPGEAIYGEIVGWLYYSALKWVAPNSPKKIIRFNSEQEQIEYLNSDGFKQQLKAIVELNLDYRGELYHILPAEPLFNRGGMIFKYGCSKGERDFYVYDITWTLPNGEVTHLPWNKIKARCNELGLKHVPEMKSHWSTCFTPDWYEPQFIYNGVLEDLEPLVYGFVEGNDPIDPSHIREGVVLRVERASGETEFFKAKSETFYGLEDQAKSDDSFVDIEESQDE